MLYGAKSTAIIANYTDLNRQNHEALDRMTTELRQANSVVSCTTNQLQIQAVDINTGATNTLTYTYNSSAKTLTRLINGSTTTLLTGVVPNSVQFVMFQRNPIGGSVSNYTTTDPSVCKVVQLSWKCSRSVLGVGETESAQSCEVVIRKK